MNILRDLDHTNIVRFYESFSQGDSFFIVMELVEGPSLQEHLDSLKQKGRRMPEPMMWSVFIQLTMALSYLHAERGVVHRDLNPSNIMLTLGNRVKITDFGLAQQRASESVRRALRAGVCAQCWRAAVMPTRRAVEFVASSRPRMCPRRYSRRPSAPLPTPGESAS